MVVVVIDGTESKPTYVSLEGQNQFISCIYLWVGSRYRRDSCTVHMGWLVRMKGCLVAGYHFDSMIQHVCMYNMFSTYSNSIPDLIA